MEHYWRFVEWFWRRQDEAYWRKYGHHYRKRAE